METREMIDLVLRAHDQGVLTTAETRRALSPYMALALAPQAPTPPTEYPPTERRRVNPRGSPRNFKRVRTQDDMDSILELCAEGLENLEIEKELGFSAGLIQRIRTRSQWASNHWERFDHWRKRNPTADLRVARTRP
jgi:hypothetical protein